MEGKTRTRGRSPLPEEERRKPAERSRRRSVAMKVADLIDARAIVRAAGVALLRHVAELLSQGAFKTVRLAKQLPRAPGAPDPRRTTLEEAVTHARRRDAGLVYSLSGEGGATAGAP
ncbi:hypothetical protein FBY14_107176 [Azospirillum brasilense]|nr:hypothetical protein FBY14_107176 [Azospirillum brasilense]